MRQAVVAVVAAEEIGKNDKYTHRKLPWASFSCPQLIHTTPITVWERKKLIARAVSTYQTFHIPRTTRQRHRCSGKEHAQTQHVWRKRRDYVEPNTISINQQQKKKAHARIWRVDG